MFDGAAPSFEITGGGSLAVVRGLFDAALFSAFGALLFWTLVLRRALSLTPPEAQAALDRRMLALIRASLALALLAGAGWLVIQAGLMADADSLGQTVDAVPTVLVSTSFGHILALQAAALVAALPTLGRGDAPIRRTVALILATAALMLQAGHGHAMSMEHGPSLLLLSNAVHLLAGGAWLGGLLPFLLAVRITPPRAGATAARSFSGLGKWCVGLVAITAGFQAWILVGSIPALLGTAYGWIACIKLLIFGALLGFACLNRYRLAPALMAGDPEQARRRLVASVGVQSGFGLAVLLAAGVLSSLAPGMHAQPVWPFTRQFSLLRVEADAGLAREAWHAVIALAAAIILAVVALLGAGWRRAAVQFAALVITVLAVPGLGPLFIPALPTSFYHSPTGFSAPSIVQGAGLYRQACESCHGDGGYGGSEPVPAPPTAADLNTSHLWTYTDGALFWVVTHGIAAPHGSMAMPGFASLTPDDRWALIDFIRAQNIGSARPAAGRWPMPVRAPSWQATCAGGAVKTLSDLRGTIVRLVIGQAPDVTAPGLVTVRVTSDPAARPDATTCIADDETILQAYAILLGVNRTTLPGTQFLIDAGGSLREMLPPGSPPGDLIARTKVAIDTIRQQPLPAPDPPGGMGHMPM